MFEIFSSAKWRLSAADLIKINDVGKELLLCSYLRAAGAKRIGSSNWRLRPKHHQMLELLLETRATAVSPGLFGTL